MPTNPTTLRRFCQERVRIAALFVVLALVSAAPARAQISVLTGNPLLYANWVQGSASAWDPVHAVYLVVGAPSNTTSPLVGVFTDVAGNSLGAFSINGGGTYSQFPWVVYSPNLPNGSGGTGAFLVTWHENGVMQNGVEVPIPSPNYVQTRIVSYPAGPVGAQQSLVTAAGSFWLSPPMIRYSSTSNLFFLAWRGMDTMIYAARLDGNGTIMGAPFRITPSTQSWQNPSLAWDSVNNYFGVLSTGYGGPSGATAGFTLVTAAGTVLGTNIFDVATGEFVTALDFNPATGHYVGVWYRNPGGTMGAEFAADGTVLAMGVASTTTGTPDTEGLAYNAASGTFLLAAQGPSYNDWGAELNARGARDSADMEITSSGGPKGSFYPTPTARPGAAQWNVSFSHNFFELHDQIIATSTTGGGPAGTLGAAPGGQTGGTPPAPPPPTTTGGCLGSAPFPGAVCVGNGWVPGPSGASTPPPTTPPPSTPPPTTGSCLGSAPFPGAVCVGNGWVPGPSGGSSGGGTTTTPAPTTSCLGSAPFPGAVCVGNGWVPGSSTGNCLGSAPFPGAVCVGNGWVPGTTGGSSGGGTTTTTPTTSCLGSAPFPGAVCVGNGWVPGNGVGTSTTTTDGTCTTPDPFTAIGGGICSGGGWRPKG
jgi:hypothetical protein